MSEIIVLDGIFVEEIWGPDVQEAFLEAMVTFPAMSRSKFKSKDGKLYNRNHLISAYIKRKTGKIRTPKQIASHLQVYKKKIEKINTLKIKEPSTSALIAPINLTELCISNFGAIAFLKKHEKEGRRVFTDSESILEKCYDILPYRKIASEKLAFLASLIILEEKYHPATIIRGITCITHSTTKTIPLKKILHYFDDSLTNIMYKIPKGSFYFVHIWHNLDYEDPNRGSYIWKQSFYSPYEMDVIMTSIFYIEGRPIIVMDMELSIAQAISQTFNYFIYESNVVFNEAKLLLGELVKFKKIYGAELVRTVLKNHARLVIMKDRRTNEILMVIGMVSTYVPNFAGYHFYEVVP